MEKAAKDTFDFIVPEVVNFICMKVILYDKLMEFQH